MVVVPVKTKTALVVANVGGRVVVVVVVVEEEHMAYGLEDDMFLTKKIFFFWVCVCLRRSGKKDDLMVEDGSTASVFEVWYYGCGAMYMNRSRFNFPLGRLTWEFVY